MPSLFDPFAPAIQEYFKERSDKIAVDVDAETSKQIRAALSEGISQGESTYTLRARVENVMGIAITQRADLIAQTESTRAHTFASIEAWGQSGVVTGKEWFSAADERRCPFCSSMDGKILGLKENFFDKGDILVVDGENKKGDAKKFTQHMDYDDVIGPSLHPRCRCVLLPITIDQSDL